MKLAQSIEKSRKYDNKAALISAVVIGLFAGPLTIAFFGRHLLNGIVIQSDTLAAVVNLSIAAISIIAYTVYAYHFLKKTFNSMTDLMLGRAKAVFGFLGYLILVLLPMLMALTAGFLLDKAGYMPSGFVKNGSQVAQEFTKSMADGEYKKSALLFCSSFPAQQQERLSDVATYKGMDLSDFQYKESTLLRDDGPVTLSTFVESGRGDVPFNFFVVTRSESGRDCISYVAVVNTLDIGSEVGSTSIDIESKYTYGLGL